MAMDSDGEAALGGAEVGEPPSWLSDLGVPIVGSAARGGAEGDYRADFRTRTGLVYVGDDLAFCRRVARQYC